MGVCRTGGRRAEFFFLLLGALVGGSSAFSFIRSGPLSGDHPAHLANAVETNRLLERGEVVGWSDFKFAGHLSSGYYPPLGALLVDGVHRVGAGRLDWDGALAISLVLAAAAGGALLLAFFRSWAGSAVAFIAVVLAFWVDQGDLWVGGRFFFLELGVWPFVLSAFLAMGAIALIPPLLLHPTAGRILATAVLVGLSVLAHPFGLVLLALVGGSRAFSLRTLVRTRRWVAAVAAAALGLLLAAWWLVPFMLRAGGVENWPADGVWGREALHLLAVGAVFRGAPAGLLPWAALGALVALRHRGAGLRWALGLTILLWLVTWEPLWPRWARPVLEGGQWVRLQIAGRWLFFALAAVGALTLLRTPARGAIPRRLIAAAALVAASVFMVRLDHRRAAPGLGPCWSTSDDADLRALASDLRRGAGRLALYAPDENRHCILRAVPWAGRPYVKLGFTPADTFADKFWTVDPLLLQRIGVTAVLSDGPPPPSLGSAPLVQRRGRFEVHLLPELSRVESLSPGETVEVVAWTDERILLRVAGTQSEIPLRLYVTASPRWEAYEGGRRVPLRTVSIGGGRFLELIARPGLVDIQFSPSIAERASALVSLISLLALIPLGLVSIRRGAQTFRRATVGIRAT